MQETSASVATRRRKAKAARQKRAWEPTLTGGNTFTPITRAFLHLMKLP